VNIAKVKSSWSAFAQKFGIGDSDDTPAERSSKATSSPKAAKTTTSDKPELDSEMESRIQQLVEENGLLTNGRVSFLDLGKIREKLGSKWPRYQPTVKQFAHKVIERRITAQDISYPIGETAYVFVFAHLTPEEATIKCSLIAKEIGEQIFGEEWSSEKYAATVAVSQIDGKISFEKTSLLASISHSLDNAQNINPFTALENVSSQQVDKALDKLNARIDSAQAMARDFGNAENQGLSPEKTVENFTSLMQEVESMDSVLYDIREIESLKKGSPKWESIHHDKGASVSSSAGSLSDKLASLIGDANSIYEKLQMDIFPQIEEQTLSLSEILESEEAPDISFCYQPIWAPSVRRIHTYRIVSQIILENSFWHLDELNEDLDPGLICDLDQLVLRHALVDLHAALEKGYMNAVVIPVHYSTLNINSTRTKYVQICQKIPKDYIKLINWEIVGCDLGGWHTQLAAVVGAIKQFGRKIILEVPPEQTNFSELGIIGVDIVGFRFRKKSLSESAHIKKLQTFGRNAEQHHLASFIYNVPTASIMVAALNAGFEYVSGDIIATTVERPRGMVDLDFFKVYQKHAEKLGLGHDLLNQFTFSR
jgi:hypothetical protein